MTSGRPLRGARYADKASASLISIIRRELPYMSFATAQRFYADFVPHLHRQELALLGCNDRYFLLTGLLNRVDAIHPWIYDRCREVEARPDGYLDLWARGHYKSTIITFAGSIQEVVCDPEITIGIFANNKMIAQPFLSQIKEELESNDLLQEVYADVLWADPKRQAPTWSVARGLTVRRKGNPKEATIEAHGLIDGMPTGRHFGLLTFDDTITERNVTNPDQIRKTTERVELADNLGIGDGTRKRFTGTRYSFADTYGVLIEHEVVKPRIYAATDNCKLDGKPIFLSQAAWDEKKKAQRGTISAQMLQNPTAGQENTFRTQWLKPFWVRPQLLNVYILVDPSAGRHKSSDRTAMAVVGLDVAGNKYLLDGACHRMGLAERWKALSQLYRKWTNMPGVQLVRVGYERYGQQSDEEYFAREMRKPDQPSFELEILNWVGLVGQESKVNRVSRLEPDFREGEFFVPGKVWHAGRTQEMRWSVSAESDEIEYEPIQGLHAMERRCQASGELWRLMKPLRRLDEDGSIYDVTRVFFEEFRFFPFAPRDDFVDAMSRIYDMDPTAPVQHERVPEAPETVD